MDSEKDKKMNKNKHLSKLLPVYLLCVILIAGAIWFYRNPTTKATDEVFNQEWTKNIAVDEPQPVVVEKETISSQIAEKNTFSDEESSEPPKEPEIASPALEIAPVPEKVALEPAKTVEKPQIPEKEPKTLQEIFYSRMGWNPTWSSLYGKEAPNFEFTDIEGKAHKLTDYRGKDVLLVFWGTWCPYCVHSIPDLIKFRNEVPEDELAILGLSNERPSTVKSFAAKKKMNYTVFSKHPYTLPSPYNRIQGLPFNVFIDKQGKIKLATEGAIPIADVKAIIKAKR